MIELNMTLVAQLLNFALAAFIVTKYGYKPLRKMIDTRQEQVRTQLLAAETAMVEAEAMKEKYQQTLNAARLDAQEIMERSKKMAEAQTAEILEKTREESARMLKQAHDSITAEKDRIMQDIKVEVSDLSILVANRLIGESLDSDKQKKLVDEYIDQLGNMPC